MKYIPTIFMALAALCAIATVIYLILIISSGMIGNEDIIVLISLLAAALHFVGSSVVTKAALRYLERNP